MSRIGLIDGPQAPLLAKRFYKRGDPGAIVASLAHVPELLDVAMPYLGVVLGSSSVPPRLKEIIVLRTSVLLECRYCINSHTVVALDAGLSRAEVEALRNERPVDEAFVDECERTLLDWIECVARGVGRAPDGVADDLRAHFDDAEIVEITAVIATTMMLNRYCSALSLPSSAETLARLGSEGLL
jgi:AhpD family alkylhydroperoxidase